MISLRVNYNCAHVSLFIFDQSSLKSHETESLMTLYMHTCTRDRPETHNIFNE